MSSPLNPVLYRALERQFGQVKVHEPGVRAHLKTRQSLNRKGEERRIEAGEWYRVCCPFCHDTRHRLYIFHHWGVKDKTGYAYTGKITCFNSNRCFPHHEAKMHFMDRVYGGRFEGMQPVIRAGKKIKLDLAAMQTPGAVEFLHLLESDHPARTYLRQRGFNTKWLGKQWQVGYCFQSRFTIAQNRIIIPIEQEGKRVSWQGRFIGDINWKQSRIPKYVNAPYSTTGSYLYNLDRARQRKLAVVVEGPTDVWNVGFNGVGMLHKKLTGEQYRLLSSSFETDGQIVLLPDMNDPEALPAAKESYHKLKAVMPGRVALAMLPDGTDPGMFDTPTVWSIISRQARQQGVEVFFQKEQVG